MIKGRKYILIGPNGRFQIEKNDTDSFIINGHPMLLEIAESTSEIKRVKFGDTFYNVFCEQISETTFEVWISHHVFKIEIEDSRNQLLTQYTRVPKVATGKIIVRAPMSGLISKIEVEIDDKIVVGQGLIVLEAMKMENEIKSTLHGKVISIEVTHGMAVEKEQPLLIVDILD